MELVPVGSNEDCSPEAPYSVTLWLIVTPLLEIGAQTKPWSAAEYGQVEVFSEGAGPSMPANESPPTASAGMDSSASAWFSVGGEEVGPVESLPHATTATAQTMVDTELRSRGDITVSPLRDAMRGMVGDGSELDVATPHTRWKFHRRRRVRALSAWRE